MGTKLYTYALLRTLYDEGEDYLDCYWPLVLTSMPSTNDNITIDEIRTLVNDKFGLDIPLQTLTSIITRGKRKDFIIQSHGLYHLSSPGISHKDSLVERTNLYNRKENEFVEDFRSFLSTSLGREIVSDQARNILGEFIKRHIVYLEYYLNMPTRDSIGISYATGDGRIEDIREDLIVGYLEDVERRKPLVFETMRDILMGTIIYLIISKGASIDPKKTKFKKTTIYVDSNFMFSLLCLHNDFYNGCASDLYKLIKQEPAIQLRIFDFTVEEMINVLRSYNERKDQYFIGWEVNSIYYILKNKGFTASQITTYISNIESMIVELNIKIEETKINLRKYTPQNIKLGEIRKYKKKSTYGIFSEIHDIAAMEKIIEMRGTRSRITRIEDAGYLFLTSDGGLSKFNHFELGHRDRDSVGEVVYDKVLTNILWLKSPTLTKDITLKSIILLHPHVIDRSAWKKFFDTLGMLRASNVISTEDISVLMHSQEMRQILESIRQDNIDTLNEDVIKTQLGYAKDKIKKENMDEIKQSHKAEIELVINSMEKEKSDLLEDKEVEVETKIRTILYRQSDKTASMLVGTAYYMLVAILICIIVRKMLVTYSVLDFIKNVGATSSVIALVLALFFGVTPAETIKKIKTGLHNMARNKILAYKIRAYINNN